MGRNWVGDYVSTLPGAGLAVLDDTPRAGAPREWIFVRSSIAVPSLG